MSLIYHITAAADWEAAVREGAYRLSTRGVTLAREGFIHASTEAQVATVANAFYQDASGLVVLEIDTTLVEPEIRLEHPPGSPEAFPHIYGPLSPAAVLAARPFAPGPDGVFTFTP
jgi:uncharacterized protein (DUF952 family)